MKSYKQIVLRSLMLAALLIAGVSYASADNRIYIDNFSMQQNGTSTVDVRYEFDRDILGLNVDITLPEGLTFAGDAERNVDVFDAGQTLNTNKLNNGKTLRLLVVSMTQQPFKAREGVLCTFKVSSGNVAGTLDMMLNRMQLSYKENGQIYGINLENSTTEVNVVSLMSRVDVTTTTPEVVINPAGSANVAIGMDNAMTAQGVSLAFTMPEGFTVKDGKFNLTSRATNGTTLSPYPLKDGRNGYRLMIVNIGGANAIQGNAGDLVTFEVVAPENFSDATATLEVFELNVGLGAQTFEALTGGKTFPVSFTNGVIAYNKANAEIKTLEDALAAALETIATEAPDVKDNFKGEDITASIESLKSAVEQAYAELTLTPNYDNVMTPVPAIQEAIAALVADAKAAQKKFEEDAAAEAARQKAYNNALAEVKTLEDALATALQTIATEAPDVKDNFKGEAVATSIADLKAAVEKANTDKVPASEYANVLAPKAGIEEAIAALIADAKAAQKKFEEDAAAEVARVEAYNNALAEVKSLEDALAAALQTIATEAPDVKDNFKGEAVATSIADLKAAVEKANTDKVPASEYANVLAPKAGIEEAIAALVADAKAAQKKFEEDAAAEAARQKAYADANAQIKTLQDALAAALQTIATEAPDVKDNFKGTEITVDINSLKASVEKAYNDKTIAAEYESLMAGVPAISDAITKLVADAKAAQQKFADDAALADALKKANARVRDLKRAFADALTTISDECPDVKDAYTGASINAQISALEADITSAFNDKSLATAYDEVMAPAEKIEAAIAKLVADAKAAQKKFEEDAAAEAARVEAYNNALAEVKTLDDALAAALQTIATEAPDVKDNFKGEAVATSIADLKAAVEKAFEDKTIVADYDNLMTPVAGISEAITKLVADAKAAQKAFEEEEARVNANKDAYEADMQTIRDLQNKLDNTVDNIRSLYPDFDVNTAKQAAQDAIDMQKEQADNALEAVEEEGTYANTVDTESVNKLIAELLEEAKTNGIDEIFGEDNVEIEAIFTTDGVRVAEPVRGQINIFVSKNGQTRRIYVK